MSKAGKYITIRIGAAESGDLSCDVEAHNGSMNLKEPKDDIDWVVAQLLARVLELAASVRDVQVTKTREGAP